MLHPVASLMFDLQSMLDRLLALFALNYADARRTIGSLIVIWLLTWIGWQLVKLLARRIVSASSDHHGDTITVREQRARTIAQLLRSAGWGVLMVLAVIETLRQFLDITPYLGGVAVIGLAVSFGAQSLVKDYFAGFFILLENQFIVGDTIEAAGKTGVVERLTLRAVTLRDADGTVHIIPNGQITTLSNKTRGWSRAVVDVVVSYKNDIDTVIAALRAEATQLYHDAAWHHQFEAEPQVQGVESFADGGVTVRTVLRTRPTMQADVAREFRRRVIIRLERDGIEGAATNPVIQVHTGSPPPAPEVSMATAGPAIASSAPSIAPSADPPIPGMSA